MAKKNPKEDHGQRLLTVIIWGPSFLEDLASAVIDAARAAAFARAITDWLDGLAQTDRWCAGRRCAGRRCDTRFSRNGERPAAVAVALPYDEKSNTVCYDKRSSIVDGICLDCAAHAGNEAYLWAMLGFAALPAPRSCWEILGVEPGTGKEEIERAFRAKAMECHPDRSGSNAVMAELDDARDQALSSSP